eukprot:scaffold58320_cov63-Phaeocystis_antarctica.AAC.3
MAALGSDAACLAAAGTTAPLIARPPSRDESLCSLLSQHPMSLCHDATTTTHVRGSTVARLGRSVVLQDSEREGGRKIKALADTLLD